MILFTVGYVEVRRTRGRKREKGPRGGGSIFMKGVCSVYPTHRSKYAFSSI